MAIICTNRTWCYIANGEQVGKRGAVDMQCGPSVALLEGSPNVGFEANTGHDDDPELHFSRLTDTY